MQKIKYLTLGILLGAAIGWPLGFLHLPWLEPDASFWPGFIGGAGTVSLVVLFFIYRRTGRKDNISVDIQNQPLLWRLLAGILVMGGIVAAASLFSRNRALQIQIGQREEQLHTTVEAIAEARKANLAPIMRSILEEVAVELNGSPSRTLRDTTVARIAALSAAFKRFKYFEADTLTEMAYSPERGQLLNALALMKPDPASFAKIKKRVDFSGADLSGADLKGIDLGGINLREARLKDADLRGANLQNAGLERAFLWGAQLQAAKLDSANLKRSDLRWAVLDRASMVKTNLNGALFAQTQFYKTDLSHAEIQWATGRGARFNEAVLTKVNFTGTRLEKADFNGAILTGADLRKSNLALSNLRETVLDSVWVELNWPEHLKAWEPLGLKELQENYALFTDSTDKKKPKIYLLRVR